jgi:hypothetical protein
MVTSVQVQVSTQETLAWETPVLIDLGLTDDVVGGGGAIADGTGSSPIVN